MATYSLNGEQISNVYDLTSLNLNQAYDIQGNELLDEFIKTILSYDTNYIITNAWLANATTQRDALLTAFNATTDGIPFFIQTDGHGRYNEGNKGCHNLAEPIMEYVRNIQLGDYESFYYDGNNPSDHARTSNGIEKYISAMGNHEFMNNNTEDALLADLPTLIASYTPSDGALGSSVYGCYKVIDTKYNVKYLITQPHIPNASKTAGFEYKITSVQYEWLIDELEANDGYDVVVIQHEPPNGTYINTTDDSTYTYSFTNMSIGEILSARKAKTSGTYTDSDGVSNSYDFTNCTTDLLCVLSGHHHKEAYLDKTTLGLPIYVADWFGNDATCCYGLIDRTNAKLKIWKFSNSTVADVLELDL